MKKQVIVFFSILTFLFSACSSDDDEVILQKIDIDRNTLDFQSDGGAAVNQLIITADGAWYFEIPKDITWVTLSKYQGTGNAVITVSVTSNTGETARQAKFGFYPADGNSSIGQGFFPITVTQNRAADDIDVFTKIKDKLFLEYAKRFDANRDDKLSIKEIQDIQTMYIAVTGKEDQVLTSLDGIEYFTNLNNLEIGNCDLTSLDLSQNTKLVSFWINGTMTSLTYLNTLQLQNLGTLRVISSNSIKQLDLSNNYYLEDLFCNSTALESINVTKNPRLKTLLLRGTQITSLDLSNNPILEKLELADASKLKTLDISKNKNLIQFVCSSSITEIFVWDGFNTTNPKESIEGISGYADNVKFTVKK